MKKTLLIVAIAVLAIAALSAGVAFAQGGNPPTNGYSGMGGMMGGRGGYGGYSPVHDYVEKALAAELDLTEAQVEEAFAAGKTMSQLALDHGIKQEDIATFMAEIHKTAFAAAVKDGVMTQEQADFMLQRMAQTGYNYGTCPMGGATGYGGRGNGMMGGRGGWQNQTP